MTKYNSSKVAIDSFMFDSKDEGMYYLYLKERLKQGKIQKFVCQPKYELIPKFEKDGYKYRAISYTPDFEVTHLDGTIECIDVKGFSTQQGEIRRKLFDFRYPLIQLTWVSRSLKYGDENGWIDYDELLRKRKRKE